MDSIHAFLLGVVQAVTEFLPISSSGHLLIAHDLLGFDMADSLRFDAALHLGTLVALLVFFWRDVVAILRGFGRSLRNWNVRNDSEQQLAWAVIVGAIPAGLVGFFLESWIESHTRNLWILVVTLTLGAGAFWWVERSARQSRPSLPAVSIQAALWIGLAQVLALMPGISRSGATIVAGLFLLRNREVAARFAFLVSLPVVTAAGLFKLTDIVQGTPAPGEVRDVAIGILTSAVLGYVVIRFFLQFVRNHSLSAFAWYRVALAAGLAVWLTAR